MKNKKYRKFWKTFDITLYFILAIIGGSILFRLNWIGDNLGFPWLIATVPLIMYFFWMAYEVLMSGSKIAASERLMEEVEHNQTHNQKN